MYQKERLNQILNILNQNGYVTVKYLVDVLHYSNATINRDLIILEKQGHVKRSYGGVEILKHKEIPRNFRYHLSKSEKTKLAKFASDFIKDNDTVFIDGSTTLEPIGRYLLKKKNITVITNNIALVSFLSQFNINTVCLGGKVFEKPYILYDEITVENASRYHYDKMFFSTAAVTKDGKIGEMDFPNLLLLNVLKNCEQSFFIATHKKIDAPYKYIVTSFDQINYIITDYDFGDDIKEKYKNCKFIKV